MEYTIADLERIRRIKIEMLNESRTKQGRLRLLNEITRLENEIKFLSKTSRICQLCLEPIEGLPYICEDCGLICCETHIDKHICSKISKTL